MPCSVGFWQSCSGCYETEDGYPVGDYPIHPKHYVPVGGGCRECKGKGIAGRCAIRQAAPDCGTMKKGGTFAPPTYWMPPPPPPASVEKEDG